MLTSASMCPYCAVLTCGDDAGVNADRLAAFRLIRSPARFSKVLEGVSRRQLPFLPGRDILQALLQKLPVVVQLLLSLVEIASIGGEGSLLESDDGSSCGAREAANKLCGP